MKTCLTSKAAFKITGVLSVLVLNSCALLLITEPDEQALRYQKTNKIGNACSDLKREKSAKTKEVSLNNGNAFNQSPDKINFYIQQLSSASDATRAGAATQLGMLGYHAKPAVSNLEYSAIHDSSKWVRRASVKSLYKIGSHTSYRVFEKAKNDSDYYVKTAAEQAINKWRDSRARLSQ